MFERHRAVSCRCSKDTDSILNRWYAVPMVNVRLLVLQGEIDIARQHWIEEKLSKIKSFGSNSVTILDLRDVQYADSTLLNALFDVKKRWSSEHKERRLCVVAHRHIAKLFEMTKLDRDFPVFGDLSSANQYASSL